MKDGRKGVVNNQIQDWSFRLDGIFHNATQDQVFDTVSSNIVTSALDGYNGKFNSVMPTGKKRKTEKIGPYFKISV